MTLRSALACAVSTIALFSAEQGYAQETQQSGIETVVVTGVRASVKSSLDIKKKSDQMVDSIVAEDIGKLPDNNVIEALQHVTGVQISRNAAEANQLLIRGLPDIATLLNGREIFTSTGRFVTLQDIPAELLARVDVEKTPRADDIEGGIAGLIDVRLHRPFDFDGLVVAGTAQGTHSSLSGATDGNASLLVSDRWSTGIGDMGLLVDLSYRQDHYKEEILDNYIDTQAIGPVQGSTGLNGVAFVPLTEGAQSINGNRQREAANVSFQWKPNDATDVYAELFATRYRDPNNVDFFVGLPWICANAATATVFPGTDLVKTVTGGCYDLTSDQSFVPKTDTYQAATGANWTRGDLTLTTEFDYTDSRFYQTGNILDTHYFPRYLHRRFQLPQHRHALHERHQLRRDRSGADVHAAVLRSMVEADGQRVRIGAAISNTTWVKRASSSRSTPACATATALPRTIRPMAAAWTAVPLPIREARNINSSS